MYIRTKRRAMKKGGYIYFMTNWSNSVLYIDGIKYTNIAELIVSNSKTFEFSVEYKDAEDNTIYYIKYLITINKE